MKWKNGIGLIIVMVLSELGPKPGFGGPVLPPPGGDGGGEGGFFFPNVSSQSWHGSDSGWASINGTGLVVNEMSGSAYIYPDYNPDDNIIARFSANINMNGDFAHDPNEFPQNNQGPSVNGQASIYEYSIIHSGDEDYILGMTNFSIGYNANTDYYEPGLWTNIYSYFNLTGENAQITNSWSDFSQNFWSGKEPMPDWFDLSGWSGNMGVSGVIVPEPMSLALLGIGGIATYFGRRRIT